MILLLCLIFFLPLLANDPLQLPSLIDMALENHPKTKLAWWKAKRASALLGSVKSARYPEIDLKSSVIQGRDFKFINGPDTTYTIIRSDLALSMMLYDFGEITSLVKTAKMALLAAQWDQNLAIQNVIVNVLTQSYQLAYEQEALELSTLSLKDAHKMVEMAEKLYKAGLKSISDIHISKASLSLMQIEITKRKNQVEIQQGKLAASLGLPIDTILKLEPFPELQNEAHKNLDELLLLAENKRADLMSRRAKIAEAWHLTDAASARFLPKLSFRTRGGYDHAVNDKAQGVHYEVAVNLDIPLFDGFRSCYNTRAAFANEKMNEEELADLELQIALDVLSFSKTVKASEEMLIYAEENLQNTHKAYMGTLDKYQIGEESIIDLSYAQKELATSRLLYSDIKTRLQVSIANLAYATGTLGDTPCQE